MQYNTVRRSPYHILFRWSQILDLSIHLPLYMFFFCLMSLLGYVSTGPQRCSIFPSFFHYLTLSLVDKHFFKTLAACAPVRPNGPRNISGSENSCISPLFLSNKYVQRIKIVMLAVTGIWRKKMKHKKSKMNSKLFFLKGPKSGICWPISCTKNFRFLFFILIFCTINSIIGVASF